MQLNSNVTVVLITPPPRGCYARGSLGAGFGVRVVIINVWPCPGIVVLVVIGLELHSASW